ncbi:hypothetical protein BaRGS_00005466 [Batillaria attramentaria]|uniref:Uncharacterized protein n=1 Tax=Batillaria attramentaria TaxID=370345 RepID=A0ABD0LUK4_9CAEN
MASADTPLENTATLFSGATALVVTSGGRRTSLKWETRTWAQFQSEGSSTKRRARGMTQRSHDTDLQLQETQTLRGQVSYSTVTTSRQRWPLLTFSQGLSRAIESRDDKADTVILQKEQRQLLLNRKFYMTAHHWVDQDRFSCGEEMLVRPGMRARLADRGVSQGPHQATEHRAAKYDGMRRGREA